MRVARVRHGDVVGWAVYSDGWRLVEGSNFPDLDAEPSPPVPVEGLTFLAPAVPTKVLCVGRNFAAHVEEMNYEATSVPAIFMKPPNAVVGPGDPIVLPPPELSTHVESEAEVAVVIGRPARHLSRGQVPRAVLGITCANDVSARDVQRSDPLPTRGKGFDTFCPLGPWIETDVDLEEPRVLRSRVNGELHQDGTTADMIHDIPTLVSHISQFTTLLPGDVILTGTPSGCGRLAPGDTVVVEVAGVGQLENQVRSHDSAWPNT